MTAIDDLLPHVPAASPTPAPRPQRIALLSFPGIRAFDISVITEVWGSDRTLRGVPPFDLRRAAADPHTPIPLRGGLSLTPDRPLSWLDDLTPDDLVLDDPLSALDVHTEARVEAALREVLRETTALVVAHRPSTVMLADRVALLSEGRIAAVGTHQELLRTSEEYAWLMSGEAKTGEGDR